MAKYVIGLDYGTDSVRALVVDTETGREVSSAVHGYTRWKEGKYCDAGLSRFRQHPLDYIEGMTASIQEALAKVAPAVREHIVGLSVDTTGSTPVPVDENNTPLALVPGFEEDPDAMFILWKDHTAQEEAEEINALARRWEVDYTMYSGGIYSPEWFWSKILHTVRTNPSVAQKAFSWVEHCDWMPALLTGVTDPRKIKRSRCAAGHKALWHEAFDGLPSEAFLQALDPRLAGLRSRLYTHTYTADVPVGVITPYWARTLGLPEGVVIGVGAIDAHFGAVGASIEPYSLVKVMGTSTCDMLIAPFEQYKDHLVRGICGQVNGSIVPGMLGMEAGQSAFGDVYSWFRELLAFPLQQLAGEGIPPEVADRIRERILPALNEKAAALPLTADDPVALDWINGRRTPDADLSLKGTIAGLDLGSGAPQIFKALVEATAFGSKAIVERFKEQGIPIERVVALGGISKRSPFVLQTLSDVLNVPIAVVRSEQACALGAAMFAATASGVYPGIREAQKAMSSGFELEYRPREERVALYETLYRRYQQLGELSGKHPAVPAGKAVYNRVEIESTQQTGAIAPPSIAPVNE